MGYFLVDTCFVELDEVMAMTAREFCAVFKDELRAAKACEESRFQWAFRYVIGGHGEKRKKNRNRTELWQKFMGMCYLCGEGTDLEDFHIEHVVPLARGGEDVEENLNIAHPACNARKGTKLVEELSWAVA